MRRYISSEPVSAPRVAQNFAFLSPPTRSAVCFLFITGCDDEDGLLAFRAHGCRLSSAGHGLLNKRAR